MPQRKISSRRLNAQWILLALLSIHSFGQAFQQYSTHLGFSPIVLSTRPTFATTTTTTTTTTTKATIRRRTTTRSRIYPAALSRQLQHPKPSKSWSVCLSASSSDAISSSDDNDDNDKSSKSKQQQQQQQRHAYRQSRPDWALDWMPTWFITLKPLYQLGVALILYTFHLTVLTQKSITFPFQLIPNDLGHFTSLGLDSLAGIGSLCGYVYLRYASKKQFQKRKAATTTTTTTTASSMAVPSLWRTPLAERPWQFPNWNAIMNRHLSVNTTTTTNTTAATTEKHRPGGVGLPAPTLPGPKTTGLLALYLLIQGYFMTGQCSLFWEDMLYTAAAVGFPMTIPMHRSLVVLLGHVSWIVIGGIILGIVPRPQPFFGGGYSTMTATDHHDEEEDDVPKKDEATENDIASKSTTSTIETTELSKEDNQYPKKMLNKYRWYTSTWNTYWIWWVMGGYFVSSWVFNVADFINQMVLPHSLFDSAAEGVVAQLVNPEHNEFLASLVGCIAPCISAPWWEEILYRGFMLPALCLHLPYWIAVWASGIIFSIHHVSATGAIPLMVLGWTWAVLYTKSKNLWVTVLVHAMWNSRVFLGNWLGL